MIKKNLNYLIFGSNLIILAFVTIFTLSSVINDSSPFTSQNVSYEAELSYSDGIAASEPMMESSRSYSRSKMSKRSGAPAALSTSSAVGALMVSTATASKNSKYIIKNGDLRGRVDSIEASKGKILEVLKSIKPIYFQKMNLIQIILRT